MLASSSSEYSGEALSGLPNFFKKACSPRRIVFLENPAPFLVRSNWPVNNTSSFSTGCFGPFWLIAATETERAAMMIAVIVMMRFSLYYQLQ